MLLVMKVYIGTWHEEIFAPDLGESKNTTCTGFSYITPRLTTYLSLKSGLNVNTVCPPSLTLKMSVEDEPVDNWPIQRMRFETDFLQCDLYLQHDLLARKDEELTPK
jgi:hypothetical protein